MKFLFPRHIFEKYSNIEVHENPLFYAGGRKGRHIWRSYSHFSEFCERA